MLKKKKSQGSKVERERSSLDLRDRVVEESLTVRGLATSHTGDACMAAWQ